MFRSLFVSLLVACGIGIASAQNLQPIPTPQRVVDTTGTLSAGQVQTLATRLKQVSDQNKVVIAVLIVTTTQPETIDAYSLRAFNSWQLGKANSDNGVLISVAKMDRKMRITTGFGVQGVITNEVANQIVTSVLAPAFKQGDFYGGINNAVSNITSYMPAARVAQASPPASAYVAPPVTTTQTVTTTTKQSGVHSWTIFWVILLVILTIVVIVVLMNNQREVVVTHYDYSTPGPSAGGTVRSYPAGWAPAYTYGPGGAYGYYDPTGAFIAGMMVNEMGHMGQQGNTTIINNPAPASAGYPTAAPVPSQDDNSLMGDMGGRSGGSGGSTDYTPTPSYTPPASNDDGASSSWSSPSSDSGSSSSWDSGSSGGSSGGGSSDY